MGVNPKITYRRKDIYTTANATGTISTTPSNLSVVNAKIFNPNGGRGYIKGFVVSGTQNIWNLYEFTYTGIDTTNNLLLNVKVNGTVNYNTTSQVYPLFEFYPDPLKLGQVKFYYIPDQNFVKLWYSGEKRGELRGFYFRAEIPYEYIDTVEGANWMKLFDVFVDDLYFYPDKNSGEKYKVRIVEPNAIDFVNLYAYRDFKVVFEGIERLDHGYHLDLTRWGSRDTNFDDRTPRASDGASWYDIMIEQNNKDETTNSNLQTFKTNFYAHLGSSTAHSTDYYNKNEIDTMLKKYPVVYLMYVFDLNPPTASIVWAGDNSGIIMHTVNNYPNFAFQQMIVKDGTLVRYTFKGNYINYITDALNINVKRGDLLSFAILIDKSGNVISIGIYINGLSRYSNSFPYSPVGGETSEGIITVLQL